MPNHYKDAIEETAKASDEAQDSVKKKPILWWVLFSAVAVFTISLVLYFSHFHNGFSDDQAVWGQFGDFMGGIVNPIVGLFTIGLLAVSLNQSNLALHQTAQALKQSEAALRQSGEEIRLAKQALLDNQKIQAATEVALSRQVAVAEDTRDIANAMALMKHFEEVYNSFKQRETYVMGLSGNQMEEMSRVRDQLQASRGHLAEMVGIVETERQRLVKKFNLHK